MKILLLTFYYPPDLSAGSYRAAALVEALVRAGVPDVGIDVITTVPNRYASYRCANTVEAGVSIDPQRPVAVHRIPVRPHRSGLADQSMAFSGFAARSLRVVYGKKYDLVVATSSRLFTGFLGALVANRTGARLYLDIRDLFVDSVRDLFSVRPGIASLAPLLSLIERRTLREASHVNIVSPGFLEYFSSRHPRRKFSVFTNGIDAEFLDEGFCKPPSNGPRRIVYAGNIGLGQGIENIVPEAALRLGEAYEFRVIGDGGRRLELERRLHASGVRNVDVVAPVNRDILKSEYRQADYLFLHLNDFPALDKVLPSKLFEYAATGKPILAGVRGCAREFIEAKVEGAAVFDPGNVGAMVEALEHLAPRQWPRDQFKRDFARERIMDAMASDILSI